ncbi:hypothetical protein [Rhodovulum adriaticum]|uniref:hypothetical protein n=1 Tax=Rhodovulum adriaticum TaxID=35804 RepID=UPI001A9E110B|nr:hypothetical protein [Rhodovulum adriaticum]
MPRFGGPDLAGKRVLLIGPAESANDELDRIDPDAFDFVGRMNKSINTPLTRNGAPFAYHNLYFRNQQRNSAKSHAGRLDRASAQECGTQVVVFVLYSWREILRLFRKVLGLWRMGLDLEVHVLGPRFIRHAAAPIAPAKPTLGFVALRYLIDARPAQLHVIGFTFFRTKYVDKYNDLVENDADAIAWATRNGKHNPEAERLAFRNLYRQALAEGRNVTLGEDVLGALEDHE